MTARVMRDWPNGLANVGRYDSETIVGLPMPMGTYDQSQYPLVVSHALMTTSAAYSVSIVGLPLSNSSMTMPYAMRPATSSHRAAARSAL